MKAFTPLLAAIACLLALPAAALGAEFTVDTINDEADAGGLNGICLTVGVKCSLRAAIEESNASVGTKDTIKFAANPFNGQGVDTIPLGSSLPLIVDPVHIDGDSAGQCTTEAGQAGPCAGVNGPAAGSAISTEADGVEIDGLAITGALGAGAAAIRAFNGAQGLEVRDNWIGVKLDGSAGANRKGIYLDPDSNGATIGGTSVSERNVISNNEFEGLDIEGADNADVLGNYFGVRPDGTTAAANGAKNIEITDIGAFEATGNEIGTTVATGPAPCDGGCNVIAGSTFGIDLQGNAPESEEPATGPTTVHGNFIGLNAAGTETRANTTGVNVGGATDALIGGTQNQDANFIAGGSEGISASSAEGLEVIGNIIGSGAPAAAITSPGKGVFVLNISNTNFVAVSQNVFDMDGGIGIEARFGGTKIISNFIEGAEFGVYTTVGPNAAGGTLIEDNVIGESLANGVLLEGNSSEVLGNAIYKSAAAGIRIRNSILLPTVNSTENVIGGGVPTDENNIRESGGDAIEIDNSGGEGASQNEVARNKGEENTGLFIDLIGPQTNGGIQPPAFATAMQSSASGTGAAAKATVRVFRKETAEAGELESFLGEAVADGSGNWKVTYASAIPTGTIVAATQTSEAGGTSELATATSTADPSTGNGGGGNNGGNGTAQVDTTPPKAKIVKGPRKKTKSTTAKFKFTSNEAGSTFQCKLDKKPFKPCKSPKKYKGLKPGKHVFKVWAIDKAGNVSKKPAKKKFEVLEK